MDETLDRVVEAARNHLEMLRANGARAVLVRPETWDALQKAPSPRPVSPRPAPLAPVRTEVIQATPPDASKLQALTDLQNRAGQCILCPHLASTRTQVVFGVGNIEAELMFIGEAPGADEDAQGEPFVGAAGELLTRIIKAMGFARESVYIANILKCRPNMPPQTSGNRKPTPEEMKTCLPYLLAQIDIIKPRVMVALGATAVEGIFGQPMPIGKMRGQFRTFRDIPVMPTFHPAYLLRNQAMSEKRKVWEDMLQVLEKLDAPISEKQRGFFQ